MQVKLMSATNSQLAFQLCSYLLSYPNQDFIDSLTEVEEELESISSLDIKIEIQQFCQKAKNQPLADLVANYIYTFDFGKKTNLYITYMSNGEQRERGMDLLFLKNYYKLHGFHVTDKELPDYLPVMLEFAGQVDQHAMKPVFERYLANIQEIEQHLDPENNLYCHLMHAILLALEEAGVSKSDQGSVEI